MILKVPSYSYIDNLFEQLNILKFPAIYSFQMGKLGFLFIKGLLSDAFCKIFQLVLCKFHNSHAELILDNFLLSQPTA